MYLSISFYLNNIYLYKKFNETVICKNNFAYNIIKNLQYQKITGLISNIETRDTLKIFENNKTELVLNTVWGLKNFALPENQPYKSIKRNILIPSFDHINLYSNNVDINSINCLCHDNTHIINLPDIILTINNQKYQFTEWYGNNQVWCSSLEDTSFYSYAYLYIFQKQSILLISQTSKNLEDDQLDLDLISIYDHHQYIEDEYERFDCNKHKPIFNTYQILKSPRNCNYTNDAMQIDTIYNHDILPN
jgi:hypothetical protein